MKFMDKTISRRITLLNKTILDSMAEKDIMVIIRNFTEVGITILDADFGFAWWKFQDHEEYRLAYKSQNTPYEPTLPREKAGNYVARTTKKPFFDSHVKDDNYEFNISKYLKSYIIIPIYYNDLIYGSLVLCYKHEHIFTDDEQGWAISLGNSTAQTITIHRFIEKEQENIKKTTMLKYTWKLLQEEKLKTEFIANATHEFRTPLAIIKGNVDLGLQSNGKKPKSPRSVFRAVNTEIKHLSEILSDLAMITSENGRLNNDMTFTEVDLGLLTKRVVKRCKTLAHKKRIALKVKPSPNITILGDRAYLEKLLTNLIHNSITYGKEKGKTTIETIDTDRHIVLKVVDDGIGISKKDLPHIFERFYRANKYYPTSGRRTGLGLAIVKWVAEIHGGQVSVESSKNKGSTFSISLPKEPHSP